MSGFVIVCKKRRCPHPKQNSFLTYFFNYRARAVLNYSLEPSESLYMSRIQEVGPEGSFHEFLKENCNVKIRVERGKWKFLAGFLKISSSPTLSGRLGLKPSWTKAQFRFCSRDRRFTSCRSFSSKGDSESTSKRESGYVATTLPALPNRLSTGEGGLLIGSMTEDFHERRV